MTDILNRLNTYFNVMTVLSIMMECLIVIYYSNSVMNYRHSRFRSNLCIVIGYTIYMGICLLSDPTLNLVSGTVILFAVLYLGFTENAGYIALKAIIIMMFSMLGEWAASLIINTNIIDSQLSFFEDTVFALASKLILYVAVICLKQFSVKRDKIYRVKGILLFLILPVSTMFLLSCFEKIFFEISSEHVILMLSAMMGVVISNFVIYIIYDKMLDNSEKIHQLQELQYKDNIDYKSYELMKEKYEDLKIMVHNFEKYCNTIEGMIDQRQDETISFVNELKDKNREFLLVEYTNNKALNIILSQKQRQCSKEKIDFQLYIQDVNLSFIKEIDIVSIFSNLLDNAIESCRRSENKKIFLSIKRMNGFFVVVSIDNSCDDEPIVHDGALHTQKSNKEQHGIGLLSIKKSLENYNGSMKWNYDKDSKLFNTIVMLNCYGLTENY